MRVEAINTGPSGALRPVDAVQAIAGKGLAGGRYFFADGAAPDGALTLNEAEALEDAGLTDGQIRVGDPVSPG